MGEGRSTFFKMPYKLVVRMRIFIFSYVFSSIIYRDTASAQQDEPRMASNEIHLALQPRWQCDVVSIHPSYPVPFCHFQTNVQGVSEPGVLFLNNNNSPVFRCVALNDVQCLICGPIIYQDELEIPVCLRKNAFNSFR